MLRIRDLAADRQPVIRNECRDHRNAKRREQNAQQGAGGDPNQGQLKAAADGFHASSVDAGREQPAIVTGVSPDDIEEDGCHLKRKAVQRNGGAFAMSVTEGARQDGGRERHQRDVHQQNSVQK
jgi:hypothetical protein